MVAVAQSAYQRAEELDGPIGLVTRRLDSIARPLVYLCVSQWLAILAFADDRVLSMEKIVEAHFPLSRHIFDKIDDLVKKVESVPNKFEGTLNKTLVVYTIKWVEFISSALVLWRMQTEKKITIERDTNYLFEENLQEKEVKEKNNSQGLGKEGGEKQKEEKEDPLVKLYEFSQETGIDIRSVHGPFLLPTIFS